jgi:hypothetical protein
MRKNPLVDKNKTQQVTDQMAQKRALKLLEFESKLEAILCQTHKLSKSTKTSSIVLPVSKSLIKSKSLLLAGVVSAALAYSIKGLMYVADNYSRKEGDEPDYTEHWDWY